MRTPEAAGRRRRGVAVVAAAVAVAAVVTGVSAVTLDGSGPAVSPRAPSAPSTAAGDPVVDLDLGPVSDPTDIAACLSDEFAPDADSVDVLYAVRQRSATEDGPSLLLRNGTGELRLCDVAGPDAPARFPLPQTTAREPVVFLTNGRMAWDCSGTTVDRFTATTWLAVAPDVARVQQRFWVDGTAGPWFSTRAAGGYAHLQTWLDGPLPEGTAIDVQHRVLDAGDEPVQQSALPTGRRPLAGCAQDDVQIG